jgi:glycosyltransferase involved in cell wall biosynthesis
MSIAPSPNPVIIEAKSAAPRMPSTDWRRWLDDFESTHGRKPRILHVGNVANNGYNNAKVLVEAGFECHALCYDYYHIMGCPEWEDADFTGMVSDHFAPDWREVDLQGFERPRWFSQGPRIWAIAYLLATLQGRERSARLLWRWLAFHRWLIAKRCGPRYQRLRAFKPRVLRTKSRFLAAVGNIADAWRALCHRVAAALCWLLRAPRRALGRMTRTSHRLRSTMTAAASRLRSKSLRLEHRIVTRAERMIWPIGPLVRLCLRLAYFPLYALAFPILLICLPIALIAHPLFHFTRWFTNRLDALASRQPTGPASAPSRGYRVPRRDRLSRALFTKLTGVDLAALDTPAFEADFRARTAHLIEDFARRFPDRPDQLSLIDMLPYRSVLPLWKHLFDQYDLIEVYATDPILTMLTGTHPHVAYEHGTIRDIPFADNATARLTSLAYARADATVITNPDCLQAAHRLGIDHYVPIPHLIDRKYFDPSIADSGALPLGVHPPYIFSPARHDFEVKGTHILLEAFARIARERPDVQLVTPSWGADLDRSRELMRSLGIEDRVAMIDPLNIHNLIRVTRGARVLVDQFRFGVFGGIGPTALAVGTPLVTHLDHAKSDWCMEPPPYFEARDVETCVAALRSAIAADAGKMRAQLHAWMRRNYWHGQVVDRHASLFADLIGLHARATTPTTIPTRESS